MNSCKSLISFSFPSASTITFGERDGRIEAGYFSYIKLFYEKRKQKKRSDRKEEKRIVRKKNQKGEKKSSRVRTRRELI